MYFLRTHLRLFLSILCGVGTFIAIPQLVPGIYARLAISWDACALFYLGYVFTTMIKLSPESLSQKAYKADLSGTLMFSVMIAAAFVSLSLSLSLMGEAKQLQGSAHIGCIALAFFTIIASWSLVQVMFAVHYTHHYYYHDTSSKQKKAAANDNNDDYHGGLSFPHAGRGEKPDFWDFLYFSLVLGMTFQVSDVQVTRRHMRRLALWHGVIAFFFNTFILASMVNMAASIFS